MKQLKQGVWAREVTVKLDKKEQEELEKATDYLCRLYGAGPDDEQVRETARQELIDLMSDLVTDSFYQMCRYTKDDEIETINFKVSGLLKRMEKQLKKKKEVSENGL